MDANSDDAAQVEVAHPTTSAIGHVRVSMQSKKMLVMKLLLY